MASVAIDAMVHPGAPSRSSIPELHPRATVNQPSNIVILPLFHRLPLTTAGVALSKRTLDLDVARFRDLLPRCSAIFLMGLTESASPADFEWNVAFWSAFTRDAQIGNPIDIASVAMSAAAPQGQRSAEYTTVANFLLESRLQLWWRNPTNITGVNAGIASGALGLRLSS